MPGEISAQMTVADLLTNWPAVFPVFIKNRLHCIGCEMARFATLEDVARNYQLDINVFLDEIRSVVKQSYSNPWAKDSSNEYGNL